MLALLLAMAGFAEIAEAVVDGAPITALDLRLANWLHLHANDSALLRNFLLGVTQLHSTPGVLGLAALAGWWLVRHDARHWMLTLVAAVPGGMLLNVAMKHVFARTRPHFDEPILLLSTYSFPSGHTVAATLLYGVLACYFTRHARSWGARAAIVACRLCDGAAGGRLAPLPGRALPVGRDGGHARGLRLAGDLRHQRGHLAPAPGSACPTQPATANT